MLANFSINKPALYTSLIVGSTFFMVLLDSTIIATALPAMARSFGVTVLDFSLGVSAFLIALAAFVPVAGWCADRFGARRIFLLSILLFCLASLLCAQATSFYFFIFARVLQGAAGALMTPVGRMMILQLSGKSELSRAMNLLTWPALSAPVLGPVIGGFIATYFDWRWIFYINLPLSVIAIALTFKYIPAFKPLPKRPFDYAGFLLSVIGMAGLLYGLESFAHGWSSTYSSIFILVCGAITSVFAYRRFATAANPLLNLSPLKVKTFAMAVANAGMFQRVGINATPFLLPLIFQVGKGYTPIQAGSYVMVYFVGNLAVKSISPLLMSWFGFRRLLFVNGLLCGLSMVSLGFLIELPIAACAFILFFAGAFRSLQFSAINTLAFADIDGPIRSSAAPLSALSMHVATASAVAISILILHASKVVRGGVTTEAVDFQIVFSCLGVAAFLISFLFLRLAGEAGRAVSHYQRG